MALKKTRKKANACPVPGCDGRAHPPRKKQPGDDVWALVDAYFSKAGRHHVHASAPMQVELF